MEIVKKQTKPNDEFWKYIEKQEKIEPKSTGVNIIYLLCKLVSDKKTPLIMGKRKREIHK